MQTPPVDRDRLVAVAAAGLAMGAVVLAVRTLLGLAPPEPMEPLATVWALSGGVALGATVAALALARRLYAPAVAVALLFVWATLATVRYFATLDGAVAGTFPLPYWLFTTAWPVVLALALVLAAVEAGLRWGWARLTATEQ